MHTIYTADLADTLETLDNHVIYKLFFHIYTFHKNKMKHNKAKKDKRCKKAISTTKICNFFF